MSTVLLILQGINLVGTLFPSTLQAALELQKILSSPGSDFTTQIHILEEGGLKSSEDTVAIIDEWKKANGFDL